MWARIPPGSLDTFIQQAYGTSVVLLKCPLVPEIMHGEGHEVFLHQSKGRKSSYSLTSVGVKKECVSLNNYHLSKWFFETFLKINGEKTLTSVQLYNVLSLVT